MIKLLKKYQIQNTPFNAIKNWSLNNINNDNLILTEDDIPIALEFIDYGDGGKYPTENNFCDLSLENQHSDLTILEEGMNIKGIFYPNIDSKNIDGTYKRSIYHQIKTVFYNTYYNPTKIWGYENIDFELSKTKRKLSDKFRLIDIPKNIFGDKITPTTVNIFDNSLDNDYIITDDGNGNLFAGKNLFSHQQEIGEYKNIFEYGSSSYCNNYWNNITIWSDDSDIWNMNKSVGPTYWNI